MNTHHHDLYLDSLTDRAWRLCDRAAPLSSAESVIAYVEQRSDGMLETTWISHGIGTATFASVDELYTAAEALLRVPAASPASKPIPIAHRPPPRLAH